MQSPYTTDLMLTCVECPASVGMEMEVELVDVSGMVSPEDEELMTSHYGIVNNGLGVGLNGNGMIHSANVTEAPTTQPGQWSSNPCSAVPSRAPSSRAPSQRPSLQNSP